MKKWTLILLLLVGILSAGFVFLLPETTIIHTEIRANVNPNATSRAMLDDNYLAKWWPGEVENSKDVKQLRFGEYQFRLVEKRLTALTFSVTKGNFSASVLLNFIPVSQDSTMLSWDAAMHANNFSQRLSNFSRSGAFKKDLDDILQKVKAFFSNQSNLYEFKIDEVQVSDSTLISTSEVVKEYPSADFIYHLVGELKDYSDKNGAQVTGFPMLNINTEDSISYRVKVALPVNKTLPNSGNITFRGMLGGGNILVTEVKGGVWTVNKAFRVLDTYIHDFHRTPPAIPFQSLITDRRRENQTPVSG